MTGNSLGVNLAENPAFQGALEALQAGRIKDVERLFKDVLRSRPRNVAALDLRGVVLGRFGRTSLARISLDQSGSIFGGSEVAMRKGPEHYRSYNGGCGEDGCG